MTRRLFLLAAAGCKRISRAFKPSAPPTVKIGCDISEFESSMAQVASMFRVSVDSVQMEGQSRFASLEAEQKKFYEDVVQPWAKKQAG